jgi:hypothetical protein
MLIRKKSLAGIQLPEGSVQHFAQNSSSTFSCYSVHQNDSDEEGKNKQFLAKLTRKRTKKNTRFNRSVSKKHRKTLSSISGTQKKKTNRFSNPASLISSHLYHQHQPSNATSFSSFSNRPSHISKKEVLLPDRNSRTSVASVGLGLSVPVNAASSPITTPASTKTAALQRAASSRSRSSRPDTFNFRRKNSYRNYGSTAPSRTSSMFSQHRNIPANAVASIENLSQANYTYVTNISRSASIRPSPIRRFFLRIFRVRFKRNTERKRGLFGKSRRLRLFRRRSIQSAPRVQISQPLSVTKHHGIKNTGTGEVLSIQPNLTKIHNRDLSSPKSASTHLSKYSNTFKAFDYNYRDELLKMPINNGDLDDKLDKIQRDLDEARRLKRRLSSRKSVSISRSSSRSSFYFKPKTYDEDLDIMRRSSLRSAGHMINPPSMRRVSKMDQEALLESERIEEALAFVNNWSLYLRQIIAVRISARQVEESQRLKSVIEEDSLYSGDTETVSSFNSQSHVAKQKELFYDTNGETISITPISSRAPSSSIYSDYESRTQKRTPSFVRRALQQDRMAKKYSALMSAAGASKEDVKTFNDNFKRRSLPPLPVSSEDSDSSAMSYSKPGKESLWMKSGASMRSTSSTFSGSKGQPRPLPPTPTKKKRVVSMPVRPSAAMVPTPLHTTHISRHSQVLQQQRRMSEMILDDMYQEMEELQARSVVLSDLAKSQMVYDFRNDKTSSSSGSEYSLIPRQKSEVVPIAHNYVLGGSRSGSPDNNGEHIMTAREAGRWDEASSVSNNKVPRKVSSASVNLSRGKQNRRRPRSIHSISSISVDEDTDRYRFDAKLTEASSWMETKIS